MGLRVAIFGTGAVGGYLAAKLAAAGQDVALVARGAHLEAIRTQGLGFERDGQVQRFKLRATDRPEELGPQDIVFIAIKAHAMGATASAIATLLGPDTVLVPAQNGIPWWYTHRLGGPLDGVRLETIDPDGSITRKLDPALALGCMVNIAVGVAAPGLVRHVAFDHFILGEPGGENSARLERVAAYMRTAGMVIETTDRIRDAIWVKLWGNLTFNPVSVLTRATLGQLADDPGTSGVLRKAMLEAQEIGERLGIRFDRDVDARIADSRAVGRHKTSMLQDFEAGRAIEIDPLLGAVLEFAHRLAVPAPMLEAFYALTCLAAAGRG